MMLLLSPAALIRSVLRRDGSLLCKLTAICTLAGGAALVLMSYVGSVELLVYHTQHLGIQCR